MKFAKEKHGVVFLLHMRVAIDVFALKLKKLLVVAQDFVITIAHNCIISCHIMNIIKTGYS